MRYEQRNVEEALAGDVSAIAESEAVQRILEVVCRTTGMGFSAVARVTEDRWIACAVRDEIDFGLQPGGELDVRTTICDEVRSGRELVVIDNVAEDDRYCSHPTPEIYRFQSYISVPIELPDGRFFGTLCAIHPAPARLNTPETIEMFRLFADLVGFHVTARDRVVTAERDLLNERRIAELRDQFMAVLGHDLRNPLNAIQAALAVLRSTPPEASAERALSVVQTSAARMGGLIENVLDFARGQLGGGLPMRLEPVADLSGRLEEVVGELRAIWPEREVETDLRFDGPIVCDPARVSQLLSNLLGNALTHGDPDTSVKVTARSGEVVELSVANGGEPIPEDKFERLFQPFSRGSEEPGGPGLGLGLYIASEIARAHGGTLDVSSSPDSTIFTFRMPRLPVPD